MAEGDLSSRGSSALNLNSLLVLLTVAGSVWLVSNKLTSDRPVPPAAGARGFVGEQTLEARLWEDPFKTEDQGTGHGKGAQTATNLDTLIEQIRERIEPTNRVLILPVMLSGGQYSEDQESRIRSRFAIVSALGRSGYAPEDAEHIGALRIPWLTQHEMDQAKHRTNSSATNLWGQVLLGTNPACRMDLRYEWHRLRSFFPHSGTNDWKRVLVLWIDDSFFEDEPLLRLPLLLESLTDANRLQTTLAPDVALIGPRRSSTLRAMLPGPLAGTSPLWDTNNVANTNLWPLAKNIITNISVYCATPSAMDEVLVTNRDATPRRAVQNTFKLNGFKSFRNYAATDAQLAREALAELALRGADLTDTNKNHLVLISEWDTFYARLLSLTYAAELAVAQRQASNRAEFVYSYISGTNGAKAIPTNFHSFVYLRGLDGQTIGSDSSRRSGESGSERIAKARPSSIEELRNWSPDANKAEGQAQFDYLSRLGDQLSELESTLHNEERGHIKAVGIVGSDVYDTLLILQALRHRFPDVLFFTTDLDARFCHPRERDWARNLIVASGYGLALHPHLQQDVAPFRDSAQTAQFAATLAALGETNLANLAYVPPRRFEIGNRTAVDLSVSSALLPMTNWQANPAGGPWLHPMRAAERPAAYSFHDRKHLWLSLGIVIGILAAACWYWDSLRCLTFQCVQFTREALDYFEEDVGGPEGAAALLQQLTGNSGLPNAMSNPICTWIATHPVIAALSPKVEKKPTFKPEDAQRERKQQLNALVKALVQLLNQMLRRERDPRHVDDAAMSHIPKQRRHARLYLDLILDKLSAGNTESKALQSARAARNASVEIFRLRRRRLVGFWICTFGFAVLAISMGSAIWQDTFKRADGELFSLYSGISAWPAEIIRLFVVGSAVCFNFELYHRMREAFFALTREFRLSFLQIEKRPWWKQVVRQLLLFLQTAKSSGPCGRVSAVGLWSDYQHDGRPSLRAARVVIPLVFYLGLCFMIIALSDQSIFNPVRGPTARAWDFLLITSAIMGFLSLAFFTIDATLLCRRFILGLSQASTEYPEATLTHFSHQCGNIEETYLDDWIDLQLIAKLTERVGRLVYYPAGLIFVLLLARNSWWDCWSWPAALIIIFLFNFALSIASVLILQRAAKEAKRRAKESLTRKLKQLRAHTAPSTEQNDYIQGKQLLKEIRQLRRGALVPFWQSPVVSAVLVPSGGMTALQILIWFLGR